MTIADTKQTSIFKCEDGKRARLDFLGIETACPELADRVRLIRARVKDLETSFGHDAGRTYREYSRMTWLAIAIGILGVLIGAGLSWLGQVTIAAALGVTVGTIAALIAAGSQAFGFHKRFAVMFAARWATTALATQIDQKIVQLALLAIAGGGLGDQQRVELEASIDHWVVELGKIMSAFGSTYGAAIVPITIPQFSRSAT